MGRKGRSGADVFGAFCVGLLAGAAVAAAEALREVGAADDTAPAPKRGWPEAAKAAVVAFGRDRISAAAAAVTFFVLLALFPAISAFVSLYGLFADVDDVPRQLAALQGLLPEGAISVVGDELTRLTSADRGALGVAFAISVAVSIWSANAGFKALMDGLNVAYETRETRGLIRLNLESLAFTIGAILIAVATAVAQVSAPGLGSLGPVASAVAPWLRLPAVLAAVMLGASVVYRFGPARPRPHWRWVTPGSAAAAVGWMAVSALFSWYVGSFGSYDRTYGSLGAIVGFLTWVWLSLMVLLFGAELNNELEKRAG